LPRRLVLVAVAALIPVLAGCEAGDNAPTVQFHYPTETAGIAVGDLAVRNVFVLGAPLGSNLAKGQSAGLFLALANTGSPDRLLSITAPGSAASVTLPAGGIAVKDGPPVLLSGPKPTVVLNDLTKPLTGGSTVRIILDFAKAGQVTLVVPVFAKAAHYATYAPPQPTPTVAATIPAKHHKLHGSPSPSASASLSVSPSPSAS
jgi:copper(I)-binding protein